MRSVSLCVLAMLLAGCGGAPDAWAESAPAHPSPQRPAWVAPVASPAAVEALAALRKRVYGRPFYAVASLTIRRPTGDRELLVRLHYRGPDRVLVRLAGSAREEGLTALRVSDGVHLWFPRAKLRLKLPSTLGAERLAGSDFAFTDLLALGADPDRWVPVEMVVDESGPEPRQLIRLHPADPSVTLYRETRLWLATADGLPLRMETVSLRGDVVRSVEMRRGPRAEYPLPTHWVARTAGPRGGTSELVFRFFEGDPPLDENLFTLAGLEMWR